MSKNLIDCAGRPAVAARVRSSKPYDPVSSLQAIASNPHIEHYKLDWNESTVTPSPKVFEALQRFLEGEGRLHWYPDAGYEKLHLRLSNYAGCSTGRLLVTNGSDDGLALICQVYLDPGDEVVAPFPTYRHFLQFAELAGATIRLIRKADPFSVSLRDIETSISEHTKIVYLANPNNPTGILFEPAQISRLAGRHPRILFLVDEAYYEFSGVSCARLTGNAENIVVARSFSKCFGLAGLRLGYVMASAAIIGDLRRVHNPKSVNMMAQVAAVAALGDLDYYRGYVAAVQHASRLTRRFCETHGIPCRLTPANFVLIQLEDPVWVAERLRDAGVHVRDRSSQLPGTIRLTVGTPEQMQEVLSRIAGVLEEFSLSRSGSSNAWRGKAHMQPAGDRPSGSGTEAVLKAALQL